jgi:hypothetical protein
MQNRLWTITHLELRGWKTITSYAKKNLETASHLFIECEYSREILVMIASWSACTNLAPSNWTMEDDVEDWFWNITYQGSKMAHTLAILTLWSI